MTKLRHAWMQKHPTPVASRGEFHWYPPGDTDRELRARCVERAAGIDPPAVLWQLAPDGVAWIQLFGATAPTDGRRYTGIVLTIAERAATPTTELLELLALPPAEPHGAAARATQVDLHPRTERSRLARALLADEPIAVDDLAAVTPNELAAALRIMPATVRGTTRSGGCVQRTTTARGRDVVADLAAAASASDPRAAAARAWSLLCELASGRDQPFAKACDAVATDLAVLWVDGALTAEERARISHAGDFVALLNAWGRGRLDAATSADLPSRLADAIALRALARLLDGDDPARAIAEVRWHALLPASRRAHLLDEIARRTPTLAREVAHA